jgi:hypothetical protein
MDSRLELANAVLDTLIMDTRAEIDAYRREIVREAFAQVARYRYNLEAEGPIGPFGTAGESPEADVAELEAIILDREQILDALLRLRDFLNSGTDEAEKALQQIEEFLSSHDVPIQSFFYSTWTEDTRLTKPLE